jgi:uncharacterized protein YlxP (DUF503 family)
MIIASCTIELFIPNSGSLKEKRFTVKSIKDKIRNQFNVSIAEVDNLDKWQRATLAIVQVSNEKKFVDETLDKIFRLIDSYPEAQIVNRIIEYL